MTPADTSVWTILESTVDFSRQPGFRHYSRLHVPRKSLRAEGKERFFRYRLNPQPSCSFPGFGVPFPEQ